jgi:hypothetical protein
LCRYETSCSTLRAYRSAEAPRHPKPAELRSKPAAGLPCAKPKGGCHGSEWVQGPDFARQLINGSLGNLGYDQDMPYILEHLTSLRQEITDLRNMNARTAARSADSQIDQSAVEMRANRLLEIKKELSQMLNRPEDPRVWWEKGGRRNRVA